MSLPPSSYLIGVMSRQPRIPTSATSDILITEDRALLVNMRGTGGHLRHCANTGNITFNLACSIRDKFQPRLLAFLAGQSNSAKKKN